MRDLLRRLADLSPGELPVLSVYLDMRPQATGANPAVRSGLVILRHRLREIERTLPPSGRARESVQHDSARIDDYLARRFPRQAQGLVMFVSTGRDLFEVLETTSPFDNQVSAGPVPDLFPLARLLDEQETAVVAVVDSRLARLFVMRWGALEEREGPQRDLDISPRRSPEPWSQPRYQRRITNQRMDFAREVVEAIEQLVRRERAGHVILAGDEVMMSPVQAALSPQVAALVEDVLRLDIAATQTRIRTDVAEILARAELADAQNVADRLIDAVRAGSLGVSGLEGTRQALERAQVDLLVLAPEADIDQQARNALVRLAVTTGAEVEVVEHHDGLQAVGGVGALLRYPLADDVTIPR